jgi:Protein of unknown function (DUF1524)
LPAEAEASGDAVPMCTRRRLILAVLCGLLWFAGGCGPLADGNSAAAGPQDSNIGQGKNAALAQLDTLSVAAWSSMSGYSRARFPHWSSQGGGCDTRDVVLKRDGKSVLTGDACKVTRGTWFSAYDGKSISDPQDLDIDHMVPLANAWRTGAKEWTDAQREQFANDLTNPQLLAVTLSTNRSKGDQDPSQWKPPRHEYWCVYAQRWVAVKSYWKLRVTAEERTALRDMLGTCS